MEVYVRQDLRELSYQAANPFASVEIRDWISLLKGIGDVFPVRAVATSGSCPEICRSLRGDFSWPKWVFSSGH
jgi:hypothetical protein